MLKSALLAQLLPYVRGIAISLAYKTNPQLRSELIAISYLALCEALDSAKYIENFISIRAYVRQRVLQRLSSYINECIRWPVRIPESSVRAFNIPIVSNNCVSLTPDMCSVNDKSYHTLMHIKECCKDDTDSKIVDLRIAGYVDSEIGKMLHVSLMTVNRRRSKLYERFQKD